MADNPGVPPPPELAADDLAGVRDPSALLDRAWALEPWSRYADRTAALDALELLLLGADVDPAPPGRDWHLELLAERAIDVGRAFDVDEALALTDQVIGGGPTRS